MAKLKTFSNTYKPKKQWDNRKIDLNPIENLFNKYVGFLGNINTIVGPIVQKSNQGLQKLEELKKILSSQDSILGKGKELFTQIFDMLFSTIDSDIFSKHIQSFYQNIMNRIDSLMSGDFSTEFSNKIMGSFSSPISAKIEKNFFGNILSSAMQEVQNYLHPTSSENSDNSINSDNSENSENSEHSDNNYFAIKKGLNGEKLLALENLIQAIQDKCCQDNCKDNTQNHSKTNDNAIMSVVQQILNMGKNLENSDNPVLFSVQRGLNILQEKMKNHCSWYSKSAEIAAAQGNLMNTLEKKLSIFLPDASQWMNHIEKILAMNVGIDENLKTIINSILQFFPTHASPASSNVQKDFNHSAQYSEYVKIHPNSIEDLYKKLKQFFEQKNPNMTKYASDDATLQRMLMDKNYRNIS